MMKRVKMMMGRRSWLIKVKDMPMPRLMKKSAMKKSLRGFIFAVMVAPNSDGARLNPARNAPISRLKPSFVEMLAEIKHHAMAARKTSSCSVEKSLASAGLRRKLYPNQMRSNSPAAFAREKRRVVPKGISCWKLLIRTRARIAMKSWMMRMPTEILP